MGYEEFIDISNEIHKKKYDYKGSIYKNGKSRIKIICPIHGEFEQTPYKHLKGRGCPKCGSEKSHISQRMSIGDFINISNIKHKNKYNYDKFEYINSDTKGIIICPIHGEFNQSPILHTHGSGCPECGRSSSVYNRTRSVDDFIKLSSKIHDSNYNYDKFIYKGAHVKGIITCKKHGDFLQTPNNHTRGQRCPRCLDSKGELMIGSYLDDIDVRFERQKGFVGCRNIRILPFDFYLVDYNICIEYDGIQHFEIRKRFGGENGLNKVISNDKTKSDYCKNNNITLLRFKYSDDSDDIKNTINKFITSYHH